MLSKIPLWLGRLSVGRKLTLIYLLDLTAVIYVSGILIHEKYLAIDFARKEIVGAHYAEVVRRNLMGAFRVPPPAAAPQAATTQFADDLQALGAMRSAHDETLHTTEASQRLDNLLQTPQSKGNKTALLSQGRDLLTIVGNQSNLILDPDLDSYYVMSLTVLRFPELLQVLYDTRDFMQHWGQTSQGQNPSAQLLTLVGRLDAVLQGMESDYEQAWLAGTPQLHAGLGATRTALQQQAHQFSRTVQAASTDGLSAQEAVALEQAY